MGFIYRREKGCKLCPLWMIWWSSKRILGSCAREASNSIRGWSSCQKLYGSIEYVMASCEHTRKSSIRVKWLDVQAKRLGWLRKDRWELVKSIGLGDMRMYWVGPAWVSWMETILMVGSDQLRWVEEKLVGSVGLVKGRGIGLVWWDLLIWGMGWVLLGP